MRKGRTAEFDLERWAEKVAEAARKGVQVERLWSEKLKAQKRHRDAAPDK